MKLAPRFASGAAGNLFSPVEHGPHEHVDVLAERGDLTIERIVSMAPHPAGVPSARVLVLSMVTVVQPRRVV